MYACCHVLSKTVSVTIYDMFILKQCILSEEIITSLRGPYRVICIAE